MYLDSILIAIVGGAIVAMTIGIGTQTTDPGNLLLVAIGLAYYIGLEGTAGGQTLGKKLVNIKVVKDDGSDLEIAGAAIRNLLRPIDALPFLYILGIILVVVTDEHQRLGDIAGGTHVVKA